MPTTNSGTQSASPKDFFKAKVPIQNTQDNPTRNHQAASAKQTDPIQRDEMFSDVAVSSFQGG